jgi:hypothetical protein
VVSSATVLRLVFSAHDYLSSVGELTATCNGRKTMNDDPIIDQIYHHAFTEALFEKAHEVLCPNCSKILESQALSRYKMMMARRRREIADLQIKTEKERQRESRKRELSQQNRENNRHE